MGSRSEDDIWADDTLGRKDDAELIRQFLIGRQKIRANLDEPKAYVLNLDSNWGGGKTFFLTRFKRFLEANGHICAYVNAWEDDHSEDPLIAVVSAVNKQVGAAFGKGKAPAPVKSMLTNVARNAGKIATRTFIGAARQVAKKAIGEDGIEGLAEIVSDELVNTMAATALDSFEKQKGINTNFTADLQKLIQAVLETDDIEGPVFVLIDELDRCRPDYAIKLLERIKHLFSVDNIVFVIATDTEQLSHAVAGTYGAGFDGRRYLKRFFDRSYHFPTASKQDFITTTFTQLGLKDEMFSVPKPYSVQGFLKTLLDLPEIELRDIKQILNLVQTFYSVWPHGNLKIELTLLLPLAYEHHLSKIGGGESDSSIRNVILGVPKVDYSTGKQTLQTTLVKQYLKLLEAKWDDVTQGIRDSGNPHNIWISELFYSEKRQLHVEGYSLSNPPSSVLKTYPELLGKLSRLGGAS